MKTFRILLLALWSTCSAIGGVTRLAGPAGADSGESNLHRALDGTVYLTWCEPADRAGERALRLAAFSRETHQWSSAQTIVESSLLMENWADFPSLTVSTEGTLFAQWYQRSAPDARGYRGWVSRSEDAGASWSSPEPLGYEFVSLAPLGGGRVLAAWLESLHVPPERRAPGVPTMQLRARLLSRDGAALDEWTVDPDVCTCCQTTLVSLPGNRAFVAYRGHTSDEIRDHAWAVFEDGEWSRPQLLHADGWKIAGCPVNGPAADALDAYLIVAWFTAAEDRARVQAKVSIDAGRSMSLPVAIDLGAPIGRVETVMLPDHSSVLLWLENGQNPGTAGLYARRMFVDGSLSAPIQIAETSAARATGFPRAVRLDRDRIVVTWTRSGEHESQVETAIVDVSAMVASSPQRAASQSTSSAPQPALEFCSMNSPAPAPRP